MRRLLLAIVLLAPSAAAGAPFALDMEDARGDALDHDARPADAPSVDILRFSSTVEGDRIVQRVEMAARPTAPADSILVRSWFDDSTNGTFWVVDMEVRGEAPPESKLRPIMRRGEFSNATYVDDVRWGVENATWVFDFPASIVDDARCFDPGVFAERSDRRGQAFDSLYLDERRCRTAPEPAGTPAPPPVSIGVPRYEPPPGASTPTPGIEAAGALAALAAVALAIKRR